MSSGLEPMVLPKRPFCRNYMRIYQGAKDSWGELDKMCAILKLNLMQMSCTLQACTGTKDQRRAMAAQRYPRLGVTKLAKIEAVDRIASIWLPKRCVNTRKRCHTSCHSSRHPVWSHNRQAGGGASPSLCTMLLLRNASSSAVLDSSNKVSEMMSEV